MSAAEGVACVANIGKAGRRQRLLIGLVGLGACVLASVWLVADGASRGWRLLLFLPWWISLLGIFQAKEQTCVALAARGLREVAGGEPEVIPLAELDAVRRQARRVYLQSFIAALLVTAASLVP
jgi:hypothetical protein